MTQNPFADLLALSQTFDGVTPLTVADVERDGGSYGYGAGGTRVPVHYLTQLTAYAHGKPYELPEDDDPDYADDHMVIVVSFGHVGDDERWVPSHLAGLPGPPVALNAGYEMGHVQDYLARRGWAIVSQFTTLDKHSSAAWVRRIQAEPAPGIGLAPERARVRPLVLDVSDRAQVDFREIVPDAPGNDHITISKADLAYMIQEGRTLPSLDAETLAGRFIQSVRTGRPGGPRA